MKQRIITALILMAVVIPIVLIGKLPFLILIAVVLVLGVKELLDLIDKKNILLSLLTLLYATYIVFIDSSIFFVSSYVIMLFAVILFLLALFVDKINNGTINFILGFITFVAIGLHCIMNVRIMFGLYALMFIAIATYGCDTGAYFAGVFFGKHKLIPRLSPKKTIEGSIGGIILGTVLSSLYFNFYSFGISLPQAVLLGFILTITAQVGDLAFSGVKRYYNIKDFSNLLPGHGGVLDRIDSLLFNSIVFALYITLLF